MSAIPYFRVSSAILAAAFLAVSCVPSKNETAPPPSETANPPGNQYRILALGDSLTAGYELSPSQSYPARLETLLKKEGYRYVVANAGVSGDTSAGLLERTDWILSAGVPDIAILCIGANDGFQSLPTDEMEKNVRAIIAKFKGKGSKVVLVGMRMPYNLGAEYVARFEATYPRIAKDEGVPFYPFLLEGVARDPSLNLRDGIHPNAEGYAIVAENVFEFLKKEGLLVK